MLLKLPLYWSYNRVIQKIFKTVLIIDSAYNRDQRVFTGGLEILILK